MKNFTRTDLLAVTAGVLGYCLLLMVAHVFDLELLQMYLNPYPYVGEWLGRQIGG